VGSSGPTTPLHYLDAATLAALIRAKQVSPREVVQTHLDRISAVNPMINAIVTLMADDALKAADAAELAVMNGEPLGPLHGVPFTIKDVIDTVGVVTQRGSKLFTGHVPDTDATVVRRFKDAGGIPLAKTNVPEFSAWSETDNLVTGRTNNPWNLDRTPGGSSGGEAAAIAAGLSPIGIGSDVAISVRGPAAFTGIAALKPTHGRVPYTGHFPAALRRLWHIGPMARSVRDVALGFSILNGPDGVDGYAIHAKNAEPADARFDGQPVRIGWVGESAFAPVDPEVSAAVGDAAAVLGTLGCEVEEIRLPFMEQNDWLTPFFTLWYGELIPYLQKFIAGREAELHIVASKFMARPLPALIDYVEADVKVDRLKTFFAGYFQKYDVLLCPVVPFTAPHHSQSEHSVHGVKVPPYHMLRATAPFNMTGLPALSVPFTLSSEHLPINVQLVSRWLDEATILRIGALLQASANPSDLRPGV